MIGATYRELRLAAGRGALHFSPGRGAGRPGVSLTVGAAFESHDFFPAFLGGVRPGAGNAAFRLSFLRFESLEDDWDASVNLNFVALTEDVYLGRRWGVTLGLAPSALARDVIGPAWCLRQDAARFGARWLVRGG